MMEGFFPSFFLLRIVAISCVAMTSKQISIEPGSMDTRLRYREDTGHNNSLKVEHNSTTIKY